MITPEENEEPANYSFSGQEESLPSSRMFEAEAEDLSHNLRFLQRTTVNRTDGASTGNNKSGFNPTELIYGIAIFLVIVSIFLGIYGLFQFYKMYMEHKKVQISN